jgi:hypothetical protein
MRDTEREYGGGFSCCNTHTQREKGKKKLQKMLK